MRNVLFANWVSGGKMTFLDENDTRIGKRVVVYCYKRDDEKEVRGGKPLSDVRHLLVNLN